MHSDVLRNAYPDLGWRELLPHLGYTFAVERVSRACSHQLVRHRIASFSQQSQRYITVKRLSERVVVPPSVEKQSHVFVELVRDASEAYQELVERGVPREDARFVLPNAAETSLLMTMDGKALLHFFGLRLCNRAQWEVRALADAMLSQCRDADPWVFNNAGPYCYMLGRCPEGRFTCGRMKEAVEMYEPKGEQ
ncbi:FAD-dependent thymidylate synthase [Candidatus Bathyarchaeota archaeon]|nr:FAD-dependent thymidylate synthase [Candidatus Bathyarchaeota archaeon]